MIGALTPTLASAHVHITSHLTRYGQSEIKAGPCGLAGGGIGSARYTYAPGDIITIEFDEFIDHPGHFRISFDDEGDDDFVDPLSFDDRYTNSTVLIDGIPDKAGGLYRVDVQLPDIECAYCTLQLVQVMTDKAPYGDGNDLYYNCVDLELVEGAEPTSTTGPTSSTESEAGVDAAGRGCQLGTASPLGLLGLLATFGWMCRPRARSGTSPSPARPVGSRGR